MEGVWRSVHGASLRRFCLYIQPNNSILTRLLQLDDKLPTLEEQGITNLPATLSSPANPTTSATTHHDRALELKRLAKSLLLNFLELTGTLSRSPAHAEAKVQDLRTLFINAHHALNEYRPHQARESAIEMMQDGLDKVRAETVAVRTQVDRARRVLEGLGSLRVAADEAAEKLKQEAQGGEEKEDAEAVLARREAEIWAAADAVFA